MCIGIALCDIKYFAVFGQELSTGWHSWRIVARSPPVRFNVHDKLRIFYNDMCMCTSELQMEFVAQTSKLSHTIFAGLTHVLIHDRPFNLPFYVAVSFCLWSRERVFLL